MTNSATMLKLMAVHAHPDDEATSTGGVLARYAFAGVQTIVVTCTNGELGDGPGGIRPGADGHDPRSVASVRLAELRAACAHLGVSSLELLGYHDSGMADWDHQHRPDVFCNVPVDTAAARITRLIEYQRPQVVVSYDANGTYLSIPKAGTRCDPAHPPFRQDLRGRRRRTTSLKVLVQ